MHIYNGEIAKEETWVNRSFKYGDGLFETIRIFQGKILFWKDHMERLFRGMRILKLEFQPQLFEVLLLENCRHLMELKHIDKHGRLRIQVYRSGKGAYGPVDRKPSFLVEAFSFEGNTYQSLHPIDLTTYRDYPLGPQPLAGCKTANALPYVLAAMHAQDEGVDDALMFSQEGYVSEGSSANLFLIQDKKLITPPLSTYCLDGVMRRHMIHLCQELRIPLLEKKFKIAEVKKADAIFLTNSTRGIIPVRTFEGRIFNSHGHSMMSFLRTCLNQYVEALE